MSVLVVPVQAALVRQRTLLRQGACTLLSLSLYLAMSAKVKPRSSRETPSTYLPTYLPRTTTTTTTPYPSPQPMQTPLFTELNFPIPTNTARITRRKKHTHLRCNKSGVLVPRALCFVLPQRVVTYMLMQLHVRTALDCTACTVRTVRTVLPPTRARTCPTTDSIIPPRRARRLA